MKKICAQFIIGILAGVIIMLSSMASGVMGFHFAKRIIDRIDNNLQEKKTLNIPKEFRVSFENEDDLMIFNTYQAASEISDKYATDRKHSLMVEYPAGVGISTMIFETNGKDCLNWQGAYGFAFDITNSVDAQAHLTLKIKSGKKEPKKSFEKELTLQPLKTVRILVKSREMENYLDMHEISYINFFMQDPQTTFKLYYDNFTVIRNDRV